MEGKEREYVSCGDRAGGNDGLRLFPQKFVLFLLWTNLWVSEDFVENGSLALGLATGSKLGFDVPDLLFITLDVD